uniref:NADH-ubiquinone oxidoreductase chain 4 n=1 Tax=Megaustenia imperator imperator TaxID=2979634 RepID=A0A977K8L1_9EUPU|nr:NADH dehydrogenase subunit 4 [Megaustenia imperator imperator]
MMSLLWISLISCLFLKWEVCLIMLIIMLMLSLLNLNQNFLYNESNFSMSEDISMLMIILSIFLCLLSIMCSSEIKMKSYLFLILLLNSVLILAFMVNNIILFYVFFEISLIPTLLLIIGWGYQPERLQAGSYMMLYTVGASLPLLVCLIFIMYKLNSFNYFIIHCVNMNITSFWLLISMFTAFLVKLPMYMYHLWLPKAHVEAPLAGSMILAGILLKLGGYGLYLIFKLFNINCLSLEIIMILTVSLWGSLLASFMCLRQIDLKSFVAYSSVAHMSLVVVGVFMNTSFGLMSMKIIMFAHGFTSPMLFFLAYITYKSAGSRSLMHSNGMLVLYPMLSLVWFISLSVNMAAPPSLNLISELLIMPTLWMLSWLMVVVMMLMMLFSAIYNMFLYTSINHGGISKLMLPNLSFSSLNYLSSFIHMVPLLLIFKTSLFIVW